MDANKNETSRTTQNLLLEIERLFKYTCETLKNQLPEHQKDKNEQSS